MLIQEPPPSPSKRPRIEALTGLRIFVAFSVLLSHMGPPPSASAPVKAFFTAGYSGVTIFFVLSGFVLAHNYFDRFKEELSLRLLWSYVVARVARIYPLYLLLLVWVSLPVLISEDAHIHMWVQHALALQAWDPDVRDAFAFNGPGWSISVEFFLYGCFPPLVFLLTAVTRRRSQIVLAVIAVAVAMAALTFWFVAKGYGALPPANPHSAHRWLYRNPLCRLGDFMLGILAARLVDALRATSRRLGGIAIALSLSTIVVLMCSPRLTLSAASWDVAYALPATVLIFGLASAPDSWVARVLATRPMILLGEASYALYLCHVSMLEHLGFRTVAPDKWMTVQGLTILMIVAMAVGLHVVVERPSRVLIRRALDPLARGPLAPRRATER
jgi:peptidoglycan/LPS O-acetylase OafA/YrhL